MSSHCRSYSLHRRVSPGTRVRPISDHHAGHVHSLPEHPGVDAANGLSETDRRLADVLSDAAIHYFLVSNRLRSSEGTERGQDLG